ncbi:MAG: sensor domain-containing diguanylate cyclase, partial [Novosphingobium sp.]|nr:sensor domain-containing diguanylate cyclase [Novosphingobium sp.]
MATQLLLDYEASGLGWFWSTDDKGVITYISEYVAQQLGKNRSELMGQTFYSLFVIVRDEDDSKQQERTLPLLLNSRKTFSELVVTSVRPEGQVEEDIWWSISGRPQFSEMGDFIGFCGNGSDVTESYASKRDASRLAMYDTLTGLANRNRMTGRLEETLPACALAKRNCAIMMIDLDRFKQVNDTFGHPAGDALLKQVAARMLSVVDSRYEIGRIGGDEFQVILPDLDDRGYLGEIAKKIIAIVSQPYSLEEGHCIIGASIGVAIAPYDGVDTETLVRNADLALYAAKGGGRGQFRFYSADLHADSERRLQLEQDLGRALEYDQMRLVYEP